MVFDYYRPNRPEVRREMGKALLRQWWSIRTVTIVDGEEWSRVTVPWRAGLDVEVSEREARLLLFGDYDEVS